MKLLSTLTLSTALFLMAIEPATLFGSVVLGLTILTLLGIGAFTSNRVEL